MIIYGARTLVMFADYGDLDFEDLVRSGLRGVDGDDAGGRWIRVGCFTGQIILCEGKQLH